MAMASTQDASMSLSVALSCSTDAMDPALSVAATEPSLKLAMAV
jgi:hypothetical protein